MNNHHRDIYSLREKVVGRGRSARTKSRCWSRWFGHAYALLFGEGVWVIDLKFFVFFHFKHGMGHDLGWCCCTACSLN